MSYFEINDDEKFVISDNTACLNVYSISRLSDIKVEDVTSNQSFRARRIRFKKKRVDSVVMYSYIGNGYIDYVTNSSFVQWTKYEGNSFSTSSDTICLYLGGGGNEDIENILIIECVYGAVAAEDKSYGFEVFDAFGKSIFKIQDSYVKVEKTLKVYSGSRPFHAQMDYEVPKQQEVVFEGAQDRLLMLQEYFANVSYLFPLSGTDNHSNTAIRQSMNRCEIIFEQDGQHYYSGFSYGITMKTLCMSFNVFSISKTYVEKLLAPVKLV